ncbi:class I SAM-dependent methyltransferase [Xanthomarina spongicola]|uniref:Methyltransferase family protein n=1 Tax=Xanthomarina spongicola TaxID=570520 RepID=A0A316DHV9_9FLAO|nr:class I SAM-dependent methyltransferase [Xanthomarina spongicola]PWK17724.1 methyltransferase family protein [Xanthomarina spongicola]
MDIDYNHKPDDYFENERMEMLQFLPKNAKYVLDVGCSNGGFGNLIKSKTSAEVWGIEPLEHASDNAKKALDKVITKSCELAIDELPSKYFDAIFFNDVLEHLIDPYSVLEIMKEKLKDDGKIISSIPNIRYHRTFLKLLFKKDWEYQDEGVLDRTHLRFFTYKSISNMYENAGYVVEKNIGINGGKSLKPFLVNIPLLFSGMDMKYPQFATVASKKNIT